MFAIGGVGFIVCWFAFANSESDEPSPWLGFFAWLCLGLISISLFELAWRYLP